MNDNPFVSNPRGDVPLWTTDRIWEAQKNHKTCICRDYGNRFVMDVQADGLMFDIANEYEAALAARDARIEELERELKEAKSGRVPVEL